jgi:hypothetical protein
MRGMRFQFPLIELLLCMTGAAIIAGIVLAPVMDPGIVPGERQVVSSFGGKQVKTIKVSQFHSPQRWEIIGRLEWALPIIVAWTIAAILIVRDFRRRTTG